MRFKSMILGLFSAFALSACVATDSGELMQTQAPQVQQYEQAQQIQANSTPQTGVINQVAQSKQAANRATPFIPQSRDGSVSFASNDQVIEPILRPRNQKTYLINGLASSVGSIGYGFTNLSKKIPGSVLHNYATFVESSTVIRSEVTRELKAAYLSDPNVEINLVGISFGANIVTLIAGDLDRAKIPVNYLVTMEGPAMVPIRPNVRKADNFSCTNLDCFRTTSKLSWGNKRTDFAAFKIKASHIPLANHPRVHQRILSVLRERPPQYFVSQ